MCGAKPRTLFQDAGPCAWAHVTSYSFPTFFSSHGPHMGCDIEENHII